MDTYIIKYAPMLTIEQIQARKKTHDYGIVAEMIGSTADNVRKSLKRRSSKRLFEICKAFTKVIQTRERLTNSKF